MSPHVMNQTRLAVRHEKLASNDRREYGVREVDVGEKEKREARRGGGGGGEGGCQRKQRHRIRGLDC